MCHRIAVCCSVSVLHGAYDLQTDVIPQVVGRTKPATLPCFSP